MRTKSLWWVLRCLLPTLFLFGCTATSSFDDALHGQDIPLTIEFQGNSYRNTGEIVAIERTPDNVEYVGRALSGPHVNSTDSGSGGLEVYSIKGMNEGRFVALKLQLVGSKGAAYYFFKYERQ